MKESFMKDYDDKVQSEAFCPYTSRQLEERMALAEKQIAQGQCHSVESLFHKYRGVYHF